MLNDAKLSLQFWEDAVSTSNYIHNRILHKGINNKIPYELLTNNKVDYSNIRVFRCKVFYYIQKLFRTNFKIIYLLVFFWGYVNNPKSYKILDLTNNKIILSRNVDFFEFTPRNSHLSYCDNDISNFIPNNIIRR